MFYMLYEIGVSHVLNGVTGVVSLTVGDRLFHGVSPAIEKDHQPYSFHDKKLHRFMFYKMSRTITAFYVCSHVAPPGVRSICASCVSADILVLFCRAPNTAWGLPVCRSRSTERP